MESGFCEISRSLGLDIDLTQGVDSILSICGFFPSLIALGYLDFGGRLRFFPNSFHSKRVMLDDSAICGSSTASGAGL